MEEFKFVLKCLLFSCVIVIFSQTRISGDTLENKALIFFKHSETAHFVRAAADGGVKLIRQGAEKTQNFISEKFGNGSTSSSSSRSYSSQPQPASANAGLLRKLEPNEKGSVYRNQQLGETADSSMAEPENEDNLSIEE